MNNNWYLNFPFGTSPYPPQSMDYCNGQNYSADITNYFSSYAYPQGNINYGYVAPVPDITVNQVAFKLDPLTDTWSKEETNSKGKIKVTPLTSGFNIIIIYKNSTTSGELKSVVIHYISKGKNYSVIMSADDYIRERYHKSLREIMRYPGCTKGQFNALVSFLLQTAPSLELTLFEHQGWVEYDNGKLAFACDHPNIPRSLLSESVKRRKIAQPIHSQQEITDSWVKVYGNNPTTKFLGYYRIGSLLQHFFRNEGVNIKQFLIAEPSDKVNANKLAALLATGDIINYPIPTLESKVENIIREHSIVFDGTVIYVDDLLVDEQEKQLSSLKAIINLVRQENRINESNGLIAIISKSAAYTAMNLSPENTILINADEIEVEEDTSTIINISSEMDSYIINTILSRPEEVKKFFADSIPNLRREFSEKIQGIGLETAIMIFVVEEFFRKFLEFAMLDNDTFKSFLSIIDCKTNRVMDANYAIENDFATILSDLIRSKIIVPKIKKRGLSFDDNGHTFLIDGDRLYVPAQIIKLILTEMRTTHSLDSLMRTLKQTGALNSTDGNSHPVELHDSSGKHIRLYLYDISLEILDADVIYMLRNLDKDAFLLSNEETPTENFLSILSDGNGRLAGKQICYEDLENGHGYVTGQSGWGKTYLLCQLIAKYFNLGHKVVIFDSSDSFEYSALCRNLSKVFVDNFVKIYDLDKEGIPVNLFKTERTASLPSQKKELLGILQSGIGELSASQTNALRRLLSSIINKLGKNGRVTCTAIINELNNGKTEETSATYESLLNRLEPLIEDIEERGMADRTWKHFLDRSRIITIIRTDPAYTESGNQLIDMMLATLYNYQCDNPQIPLDVFIDELQNQNFSKTSPIRKVLKEGRRFHISFFGATQDYYPRNTELGSVMGKAGTQIFLRPTPNSENVVASELRYRKADMLRFDSMQRGDIIVKGNLYSKEAGRNVPTTLSGHVDDCPKIPSNYYDNVL